jgi:predicted permease
METEMQMHLELRIERNIAAGMPPEEARYAALRSFGGYEQIKEHAREQRGGAWLGQLVQDIRYGLRMLARSPVFTTVAVLSLALGIGTATAVFSLVNAILLGSLPVPNPQELRAICWSGTDVHMANYMGYGGPEIPGQKSGNSFSSDVFSALRKQCKAQAEIFGYAPLQDAVARARREAVRARGLMVSDNYFSVLGVRPLLGSLLGTEGAGAAPSSEVVISYKWWERQFDLDPGVIGQQLVLNGHSLTVVGVLPPGFTGVMPGSSPDLFVPLLAGIQPPSKWATSAADSWWIALMGRLRPGVSDAQLQAVLDPALDAAAGKTIVQPKAFISDARNGPEWEHTGSRNELRMLLSVVSIVVLVACANLAGLLLTRGASRQHELSVRGALGASRWRLVRQLMTESMLLSVIGGGLGMLIAIWGKTAITRLLNWAPSGPNSGSGLDFKVLGFALGVTTLTGLLTGLVPAFRAGRVDPINGLRGRFAAGAPRLGLGQFLVAAQIALSLLLVTGAGLYARTLLNLVRIDPGFSISRLLVFVVTPNSVGFHEPQITTYYENLQRSLAAIPGVQSATLVSNPMLSSWSETEGVTFPDRPNEGTHGDFNVGMLSVGENFFAAMGIPMLLGRDLQATDTSGAPKVIVVNESFVRKFLSGRLPLGRTVSFDNATWQIVGVCRDAKVIHIKQGSGPMAYSPFRQRPVGRASFTLRTMLPPLSLAALVRKVAATVDPNIPVTDLTTVEETRDQSISSERMFALYCGLLASLALFLSCIGFYGLMAYEVSRRTGEIGVRMALGATSRQVVLPILRNSFVLAGAGVAAGLPLTVILTRVTSASLYGVTSSDPLTLCAAVVLMLAVVLIGAWVPARRAARVDPIVALRCD